ncbi:MAG: TetR family transcriptional regulator [Nocardioides sp.]|uniref:acyl-CoA-like ligand-binding transcription factor n=1 Tax=Nocardioides sp. TaxID=35761 RepID=UPI003F0D11AD
MVGEGSVGGRPPVGDVETIRARLLALMVERGYDSVTMAELAAEAGTSVRTLHRYFPGKADIVWGGIESSTEALNAGLEAADPAADELVGAVRSAVVAAFARNADGEDVMRSRLRLIALSDELRRQRSHTFDAWRAELTALVARVRQTPDDDLVSRALAAALHAVMVDALTWWAVRGGKRSPADCLAEALDGLAGLVE